jgi:hypothetical protein
LCPQSTQYHPWEAREFLHYFPCGL